MRTHPSPLKWVGSKRNALHDLLPLLPAGNRLIEPFVGGGSVFLATRYPQYLLADGNANLINFYRQVQTRAEALVAAIEGCFIEENRCQEAYDTLRRQFNDPAAASLPRAALLVYLNKFGFRGLYRTNRQGCFNTPYGHPPALPAVPREALLALSAKLQGVELLNADFAEVMALARPGDVVYCDPPYADSQAGKSFSAYGQQGFDWDDQKRLVECAWELAERGITVVISNHDTAATRTLYAGATIRQFAVRRQIGCGKGGSANAKELVAVFPAEPAGDFVDVEARLLPQLSADQGIRQAAYMSQIRTTQ